MSVEIPPVNAWLGLPVIVHSMQEVANHDEVWPRYLALNPLQRENFRVALSMDIVVPFFRVLEVSRPVVVVPPVAPVPVVPMPESIVPFQTAADDFLGWLTRQATLVRDNGGLRFVYGDAFRLSADTVSVPIVIQRNGVEVAGTRFVFHYHPSASGPSVGHGYASEAHFKPYDSAPKYIRVEHHQCNGGVLAAPYAAAKAKARAFG